MPINNIRILKVSNPLTPANRYNSFIDKDLGPIRSAAGLAKIRGVFSKIEPIFNVYFVDGARTSLIKLCKSQSNIRQWLHDNECSIDHSPDSITILYSNNMTSPSNYVPFTGWMIAHRLHHIFTLLFNELDGEHITDFVSESSTFMFHNLMKLIFEEKYKSAELDRKMINRHTYNLNFADDFSSYLIRAVSQNIMTMRSARLKKLNVIDIPAELFAQYIITGSVKFAKITDILDTWAIPGETAKCDLGILSNKPSRHGRYSMRYENPPDIPISYFMTHMKVQQVQELLDQYTQEINEGCAKMLESIKGKIVGW